MNVLRKAYFAGNKVSDLFQKVLKIIVALLVLGCAFDLLLQVVYRFVLVNIVDFSMTWTNEIAQDFIVWITYLTIGICYKENSMAAVNFIYDKLGPRAKMALYVITRAIIAVFLYYGLKYGMDSIQSVSGWRSASLQLPGFMLYGAPVLGCVLIAYEAIVEFIGVLCGELKPFTGRPEPEEELELTDREKEILAAMEKDIDTDSLTKEG